MSRQNRKTPSRQDPQTMFEDLELGVFQSTNVNELDEAYRTFSSLSPRQQEQLIEYAGAARVVALALRGYELPDARTRSRSSQFVLQLGQILDRGSDPVASEQFWLMLAQQQEILLAQIEADLEALQRSSLTGEETKRRTDSLGQLHNLLRRKADEVVRTVFATDITAAASAH